MRVAYPFKASCKGAQVKVHSAKNTICEDINS